MVIMSANELTLLFDIMNMFYLYVKLSLLLFQV